MKELLEKISLQKPDIRREALVGHAAGIRPFRKGGIRLEGQRVKDKYIVHNYGHGGAGFSLSYGSGYIASEIAQRQFGSTHKQCAVLGAGYVGLFTAICLRQKGYKVTLYSQRLPFQDQSQPKTASEVAPGYWMPYDYNCTDEVLHQVLARTSFQFFAESARIHRYKGLFFSPCYRLGTSWPQFKRAIPAGLIADGKQVMVQFGDGVYHEAFRFTSIFSNGSVFLTELVEECKLRGVEIIKRKFKNLEEVMGLKEKFVYNCLGAQAFHIFGDKDVYPVKGTVVYLQKPINYYFSASTPEGTVSVYPNPGRLVLGLSKEEGKWSSEVEQHVADRILLNALKFFAKNGGDQAKL